MPESPLPDGYTARPPTQDDAEAILALAIAYTAAVIGIADYTIDDVRDDLNQPGFDIERDAWLVFGPDGLAGYGWVGRKGDSDEVDVDILAAEQPVARWLIAQARTRGQQLVGGAAVTLHHGVYRDDKGLRAALEAEGFHAATTFHRMRVDHPSPLPLPEPPDGVRLLHGVDPAVLPLAHEVVTASFAEHFGVVAMPYDLWHEKHAKSSTFDWSQLWVAELDGQPVGVLICNEQFVEDENCGYVADLGVLPAARGRGVAKYLLRHAFAVDAAAARAGTMLHVDSNNTTPALGLYTSVGMRPVLVLDAWVAELDAR